METPRGGCFALLLLFGSFSLDLIANHQATYLKNMATFAHSSWDKTFHWSLVLIDDKNAAMRSQAMNGLAGTELFRCHWDGEASYPTGKND